MKLLKNTRKKVVTLSVASALGGVAMMSAPAHAINVAQDGKGEVLLFPYYTVKAGYDTLFSVYNTADRTALIKVRWREAKNSREVRDFNVALSPHDVWTGVVTIDGTAGALVRTFDKSCTSPPLFAGPNGSTQVAFDSVGYDGSDPVKFPYDNGGRDLNRVQEGYFEIIEMAISTIPESAIPSFPATLEYATQHVAGVPRNCKAFDDAFLATPTNGAAGGGVFSSFTAPANVLVGNATLINIGSGQAYDATPTAIQAFQDSNTMLARPGDLAPDLSNGEGDLAPPVADFAANMLIDGVAVPVPVADRTPSVAISVDAVSTLLMADTLINEYASGSTATSSAKTDWVVTYPTKHFYTDQVGALTTPIAPFAQVFTPTGQSCDGIRLSIYDREENTQVNVGQNQFSPVRTGPGGQNLCNEVNVVTFNGGAVLGSGSQTSVDTTTVGTSGWANLRLTGAGPLNGYRGLPAIGFSVVERNNSVDAGNNRNYGSGVEHARTVSLSTAP